MCGAHVTRVLFDSDEAEELVATGVEYFKDGVLKTIKATKEFIISCGKYPLPQNFVSISVNNRGIQDTSTLGALWYRRQEHPGSFRCPSPS